MPAPDASDQSTRHRVEQASAPVLARLGKAPTVLVAGLVGIGVLTALVLDSRWSAVLVLAAVAFLGWLTYLAWPRLERGPRLLRLVVLGALCGWALARLL